MLKGNQFLISFLAAQLCTEIYLLLPASTAKQTLADDRRTYLRAVARKL